jgi:hypothetical protein
MKNNKIYCFLVLFLFLNLSLCAKDIVAPKGWRFPDAKDFQDTWRNEDQDKYVKISGDFNGDHILDIAMLFVSDDRYAIGLFAFLGQINGKYKTYQLCEMTGLKDDLKMGIRLVKPGSYKTAYGKKYVDRERLEDEPDILVLEKDAINLFEFDSTDSIFYWNVIKNQFVRVWMSD